LRPEHADVFGQWCAVAAELRQLAGVLADSGSVASGPHGRHPSPEHAAAMRARSVLLALGRGLGLDPASEARMAAGRPTADDADEVAAFARSRDQPRAAHDAAPMPPTREGHQQTVLDYVRRNRDAG
jgi:phage terminase small subunit